MGLVSGGTLCVDEGERFSTYTRVSAYEDWIRATMAGETEVADLRVYPDFSLAATFADEQIVTGFTPDPIEYPLQAGGYLWAGDVDSSCVGFVAEAPDVRITYEAGDQYPLRFFVEAAPTRRCSSTGPMGLGFAMMTVWRATSTRKFTSPSRSPASTISGWEHMKTPTR